MLLHRPIKTLPILPELETAMTPQQKRLVSSSFARIAPNSGEVAAGFYTRLFEKDPSLRALFKVEMRVQEQKFMQMLTTIVASMDPLEGVIPVVWPMGKRHVGYGVRPEHYVTVGSALLETLEAELGAGVSRRALRRVERRLRPPLPHHAACRRHSLKQNPPSR